MMAFVLFFIFAAIAVAAAVMMISHRNPVYCALFLILTMFAIAGLYVLLNAPFIAAIHIIVYAGAIMVLFLFVVMLLDGGDNALKESNRGWPQIAALCLAGVLFVELAIFVKSGIGLEIGPVGLSAGDTSSIGGLLFTEYLFPFEIASVLLLAAIIGSVILAKLKLQT